MNKYGAKRTWSELCQRTFDSKAECIRGEELRLLEMAGEISGLQYQVPFTLYQSIDGKPAKKITITIDFMYCEPNTDTYATNEPKRHYEDVKGVLTRDFRTKLAWLKQLMGIDVKLIR